MNIGSSRQLAGENWGRYIDTSDGLSFGNWQSIVAVSASTINIAASNTSGNTSSVSLLAGQEIRGRFTSLTVVSGAVICRSSVWQKGPGGIYTSPSQFAYDDYADWSGFGGPSTIVNNGSSVSSNLGKTVTISSIMSTIVFVQVPPVTSQQALGIFPAGDYLIYSWGNTLITFSLSSPVKGVGLSVQAATVGPFACQLTAKDSSNNPIATDISYGYSSVLVGGYLPFVGYQSGTANISKLTIELTDASKLGKFFFNRLLIKS